MLNTRASVLCSLCGMAGTVDVDVDSLEGRASAVAWAVHFTVDHPAVTNPSRYIVMAPTE